MTDDFIERATHMLKTADDGSSLVSATCDGKGMMVQVKHGNDPAGLVHIARSLLEQAGEHIHESVINQDGEDAAGLPSLYEAIFSALACLPDANEDDEDDEDDEDNAA